MSNSIYVVTISLDTPLYLTTFHRDISYNGNTYRSGLVRVNSPVIQKTTPSANDFDISLSTVDQTMVSAFANSKYKGRRCLIESLELDSADQVTSNVIWLDGECNKYAYTKKEKTSGLTLSISSIFGAFDSTNMLNIESKFKDYINIDGTLYWGKAKPIG